MLKFAESVLGPGTPVDLEFVRLVRSLGPESEHVAPVTDPATARAARIETRREWADSLMSDVPDRYPLFELLHDADLTVWPELGTAVDHLGHVAAHLLDSGQWMPITDATSGEVVVKQLASGRYIVRTVTDCSGHGFEFNGAQGFLNAAGRASARIEWLYSQTHEPQDRG